MLVQWMKTMRTRAMIRITTAMAVAMTLVACAHAQISLSTVVDLALKNDPKMRVAQADVDKAQYALNEVQDAYIPNAGISGGYGKATGVPLSVPEVFNFSSQSLLFNFSQRDYIRAAEQGLKAAKLSAKEVHDQIAEDAVVSYINLEHAQRREAAINDEMGHAERLVTIVNDRVNAGVDTQMSLLDAQITAKNLHYQKLVADDEAATLSEHLARMIGLIGNPITTDSTSVPPLPAIETLTAPSTSSFGIQALFASAHSKQQTAFGDARWKFRPQANLFVSYAYIDTAESDYETYYPGFHGKSRDAASIGLQVQIPLFDRARENRAREAFEDAVHARADAQNQKNVFQEGRLKLLKSATELSDLAEIADLKQQQAKLQLDAVVAQLAPENSATGQSSMTPKDEQNARLQERARYIDLLNAQFELQQAKVNLLRQTGHLDDWLNVIPRMPTSTYIVPTTTK